VARLYRTEKARMRAAAGQSVQRRKSDLTSVAVGNTLESLISAKDKYQVPVRTLEEDELTAD
jgi:hypothetical protein